MYFRIRKEKPQNPQPSSSKGLSQQTSHLIILNFKETDFNNPGLQAHVTSLNGQDIGKETVPKETYAEPIFHTFKTTSMMGLLGKYTKLLSVVPLNKHSEIQIKINEETCTALIDTEVTFPMLNPTFLKQHPSK